MFVIFYNIKYYKMEEIWKEHPTLGIKVSNFGRVETCRGKHISFGSDNGYGYKIVGCKGKMYMIHRLVYETFSGEIPDGMQVNHIDENKANNMVDNLNLMTNKENCNYGTRNKRLSKVVLQFTKDGRFVREWASTAECGTNGFNQGNIVSCCNGKLKSAYGYIWRYKTTS